MAKAPYFPPPPPLPPKTRMFQRMPPAVFTPIMGAFGLGLAWRRAADILAAPAAIGEIMLGALTLLYLFSLAAYAMKFMQRTGIFSEDLRVLPGRAGLAAMVLTGYLLAATIEPFSLVLAGAMLLLTFAAHVMLAGRVIYKLITGPVETRIVTPVWHLIFAGFVLIPLAAVPLGWTGFATIAFWGGFFVAAIVWGASAAQFLRTRIPGPLRPLLAIHLVPASVLGTGAYLLGETQMALVFSVMSIIILSGLIGCARWLLKAGFSPLWGAFTFPLAAFSSLMQLGAVVTSSDILRIVAGASLVAATLIILPIIYKIIQMWTQGVLAAKTNAATA
ncbi:tellurite resistance protein [Aliiroseovarius sediminilitoris]|uniref:Tellurite resistance protein n=1 Tax=Aliiroseovarius sediminilitoris TaxID=1173584 RepID=A0A1I0PXI9_9RHOB|nr:tellurium resistance protein [Aliiroseovarius sediminilitoris]SEW18882.1 tellurite resistance protein [Aliiroseovarius sediminilitoris]